MRGVESQRLRLRLRPDVGGVLHERQREDLRPLRRPRRGGSGRPPHAPGPEIRHAPGPRRLPARAERHAARRQEGSPHGGTVSGRQPAQGRRLHPLPPGERLPTRRAKGDGRLEKRVYLADVLSPAGERGPHARRGSGGQGERRRGGLRLQPGGCAGRRHPENRQRPARGLLRRCPVCAPQGAGDRANPHHLGARGERACPAA